MNESSPPVCVGWVKLFHPTGVLCSLPIDGDTSGGFDYSKAFRCVQAAVLAGFTVSAPGLEAGEQREEIGFVCRMEKENKDKSITPYIHLYSSHDAVQYKVLSVYLNDEGAVSAFERASGFILNNLSMFPGTAAPKRGESTRTDKFIYKALKPFGVVMRPNPRYDEKAAEEAKPGEYKIPKREFVRWEGQQAEAEKPTPTVTPEAVSPDPNSREANGASDKPKNVEPGTSTLDKTLIGEWERFLLAEPTIEEVNRKLSYLSSIKTERTRRAIWSGVKAYAEDAARAWEFDGTKKVFVAPVEQDDEGVRIGKAIPF